LNPIHTNKYFSIFAELPHDTITHGMWTSANARRVIESFVAKNKPERVVDFHTEFVGMVKPRDQLLTSVRHIGMKNGRYVWARHDTRHARTF
jgi:fatty acid synthase subunit beta